MATTNIYYRIVSVCVRTTLDCYPWRVVLHAQSIRERGRVSVYFQLAEGVIDELV